MASFQDWQEVSAALRTSLYGQPGEMVFRFLDRLSSGHRSLYPFPAVRGFLIGLAPWGNFPEPLRAHLQVSEHSVTLFRITLMDFHEGRMVGWSVDVCPESVVDEVFNDYLLRLRHGDPRATAKRIGPGWKMHPRGKSRVETISEWLARPGDWGADQLLERPRRQTFWLAECASVRWWLTQMACPESRQLLRFFKPRPNRHDPAWLKRLAESLPDFTCGGPASCPCREVLRYLDFYTSGHRPRSANSFCFDLISRQSNASVFQKQNLEAHRREVWRELLGNPFDPVAVEPTWLAFQDGVVVRLTEAIEEDNDFSRMPILGDALEEAGCSNELILNHCRTGTHLPGCWLLDLLTRSN
jgi:hypothetical protein